MKENKINVAELLKDCPTGMELDCTMFENLEFDHIDKDNKLYPIRCRVKTEWGSYNFYTFTEYGCYGLEKYSKCIIFPKGKTTWEGFQRPFKDGDVIISNYGNIHLLRTKDSSYCAYRPRRGNKLDVTMTTCITVVRLATEEERQKLFDAIKANGYKWNHETKTLEKLIEQEFKDGDVISDSLGTCIFKGEGMIQGTVDYYCGVHGDYFIVKWKPEGHYGDIVNYRFATEEERQKLFDAIKANGYKWNFETKTLEKLIEPKFKIGDKIKKKGNNDYRLTTIESINNNYYVIKTPDWFDNCYITDKLYFSNQDNYELVPSKFDITTLKPFDSRVLVRDANCYEWEADIFGRYSDGYITLGGGKWKQCIPYEGNEHLLGTANDCDNYYKNWE